MMPHCGRDFISIFSITVDEYVIVSPGRTGFGHFMSRKPGEGPPAGLRPVSSGGSSRPVRERIIIFIQVAVVCQPLAVSPPKGPAFAASASIWEYCGSYFVAKRTISASVKV